jgi:N-acetylglucosamine kinase-like BadF-type ATPase
MSLLVAGIDGGQSSTVALIADERGRILSRGTAGPADEVGSDGASARLRDALQGALADACRGAGLPGDAGFAAVVAGVSGYEGRVYGRQPELPTDAFLLMHDAPIAHAGALAGSPGVVVIAGTGSVVYSRDESAAEATYGGWGYLFGDEGSAFHIARDALALLMRAQDDGDASLDEQARAACEFFQQASLRKIARAYYCGAIAREALASFAPAVLRARGFRAIVERNAGRLAALAGRALASIDARSIALTGGLFADDGYRARVGAAITAAVPGAHIVEPRYEPAGGALLLAYRELGLPIAQLSA